MRLFQVAHSTFQAAFLEGLVDPFVCAFCKMWIYVCARWKRVCRFNVIFASHSITKIIITAINHQNIMVHKRLSMHYTQTHTLAYTYMHIHNTYKVYRTRKFELLRSSFPSSPSSVSTFHPLHLRYFHFPTFYSHLSLVSFLPKIHRHCSHLEQKI